MPITPALIADGWYNTNTDVNNNTSNVLYAGSNNYWTLIEFGPVNVAQAATITSATLTLNVATAADVTLTVFLEDADDATAVPGTDPSTLTLTTASTALNGDPGTGAEAVDVTAQVQEVVDRGSWAANNDMLILIRPETDAQYLIIDSDESAGADATLSIVVGGGGGGIGIAPRHHMIRSFQ